MADDLIYFTDHVWVAMKWDQYAPLGWMEYDILDWVETGPPRQGVLAPRGHGKTHLITAMLPPWDWYKDAEAKCLLVSKSRDHAKQTLSLIREMLRTVPFLNHLLPTTGCLDQAQKFNIPQAGPSRTPSLQALGVESQLPGTRAGRILADDIETPENTQTFESRLKLKEKANELWNIATYGDRRINFVGTFQHHESVYKAMRAENVPYRAWPMLYPRPDEMVMDMSPTLRIKMEEGDAKPGDIVADYRYDWEYVAEHKAKGLSHWGNHYMLLENLGDRDRYRLRLRDLIVLPVDRDIAPTKVIWGTNNGQGTSTRIDGIGAQGFGDDGLYAPVMFSNDSYAPYTVTRMWVDPSGKGADKTGVASVGQCMGHLHVKALMGLDGGTGYTVLTEIAKSACRTGATEVHVEDFAMQGTVAQLLEPVVRKFWVEPGGNDFEGVVRPNGWKCTVELTRPIGGFTQKEQRMLSALEPVIHNHRLVVDPAIAANTRFQYQLTRLTSERNCLEHEDELEALANCVALFQDDFRHDQEDMQAAYKRRILDEGLAEHRKLSGLTVHTPSWFTHH